MTASIRINGATRLYAIVGDPIVQVRSPETFTERFVQAGVNAVLVPAHVPAARFDAVVPGLMGLGNLDGLIFTVPFKARAVKFADELGPTARLIGALNALRHNDDGSWTGDMFDGAGFVRGAEQKGERVRGRHVALFGAGGAGSAIACELARAGVASIDIIDPDKTRANALVEALRAAFPDCRLAATSQAAADADMIVNASPVGMRPTDGMPAELGALAKDTLVGDVVITESPTPIIRHAIRHGCPWVSGRDMHAGQLDLILGFLGQRASPRGA